MFQAGKLRTFAVNHLSVSMALLLVFLGGAMLISFVCSILESVLMSTPLSFITMREESGYRPAFLFRKYKTEIDKPIAAILSLNTIANTIGAAGVGRQATLLFGSAWFGVVSAITTLLILIFSEIIPKTIGTSYWHKLMGFTARTLRGLIVIMYPLVALIRGISRLITPKGAKNTVSREEVSAMANVGEKAGVIEKDENKIIQNVIRLDNIKVGEAMTPRVVAVTASESMILKNFYNNDTYLHYSRIPLYNDSPEYITGYVLLSDALEGLADDRFDMKLSEIKREISCFNEEMSMSDVWDAMMKNKQQMAIIVDEYGCFQGIITLEDIIETIFGLEIIDENDEFSDMQQYARDRWEKRQKKYKKISIPE